MAYFREDSNQNRNFIFSEYEVFWFVRQKIVYKLDYIKIID